MKNGKAPAIDSLQAELLKADIVTSSRLLETSSARSGNKKLFPKTGVKVLYSSSQRKVISVTVIIGRELLPYFLCQARYSAGYYLSTLERLLMQHSEKNKQGLEEEEVVWTRPQLFKRWIALSTR